MTIPAHHEVAETKGTLPMANREELSVLLEKLKTADGPDRELDGELSILLCGSKWQRAYMRRLGHPPQYISSSAPEYTASVDTALALVRQKLPGWEINIQETDGVASDVYLIGPEYDDSQPEKQSSKPFGGMKTAIALCAALLTALIGEDHG